MTGPLASLIFAGASDFVRIEMALLADIAEFQLGDQHGEISYWSVHTHRKLGNKLEYKINVIGEVAIGIYATVFTSSIWLFMYVVGLKGFATTAIFLSPLAFIIIFATLRRILNKDRPGIK